MGSGNSKETSRRSASFGYNTSSGSSSWAERYPEARPYAASSYPFRPPNYPPSSEYLDDSAPTSGYGYEPPTPSYSYESPPATYAPPQSKGSDNKLKRRYSRIADNYFSLEQVSEALAHAGLESSNLIAGIDFTKSNELTASSYSYESPPATYVPPQSKGSDNKLQRRYSRIEDNYTSLEQVSEALAHAGLESSNLILGIDFTKSNEWTGAKSFNRQSLHHIGDFQNPYEQAISIIGRTLSPFDEDNLIPCFGFGDATTHDQDVFSFYPDERQCRGFGEALKRYREIVPHLQLAGPTSFAPIIETATTMVEKSGGQYHVLVIIADGQVTRSVDTEHGHLSPQEQNTVDAIVRASEYPLSIIFVGVGDEPWDMMKEFDDNIPARAFDNFQFVNFTEIMSKNMPPSRKERQFALSSLMEIPSQYKATLELDLLGRRRGKSPDRVPLPPPLGNYGEPSFPSKRSRSSSFQPSSPYHWQTSPAGTAPPASAACDNQVCPICLSNPKDMAFGCGHQTCCDCGECLTSCPICRSDIHTRIKLY